MVLVPKIQNNSLSCLCWTISELWDCCSQGITIFFQQLVNCKAWQEVRCEQHTTSRIYSYQKLAPSSQSMQNCFLQLVGICGILFDQNNSLTSLVIEWQISKLIPWTKVPSGAVLGWAVEERDSQGNYCVLVGRGGKWTRIVAAKTAAFCQLLYNDQSAMNHCRNCRYPMLWQAVLNGEIKNSKVIWK